jgi:hypothetical protein
MKREIFFSEYQVEVMGQPLDNWHKLSAWLPLLNSPYRTTAKTENERRKAVFDDLGINFLLRPDGDSILDIGIYFFVSKKQPHESVPKNWFKGTLKLERYRLRQGMSRKTASVVEHAPLGPFKVHLFEHNEKISLCSISFGG